MLSRWKNHSWNFYFLLIVFVSMFIFFTSVHCLIIYDGDDWVNLSQMRLFVPMWRGFNPIKILPETLMPLVGYLSGYAITPITKNYVAAVTLLSALLVSGFITLYMYLFNRFIGAFGERNWYREAFVCIIIFLVHFLIFKQKSNVSPYLFWSINLTCYYHYLIPALFNISLVLYFFRHEVDQDDVWTENRVRNSLFIVVLYLGIFSNILHSIILTAFIGALLLEKEGKQLFFPKQWKRIFKENRIYGSILSVWFISLIFEANGGRARSIATTGFVSSVLDTLKFLGHSLYQVNLVFLISSLLVISFALYLAHRSKSAEACKIFRVIRISFVSMAFVFIYLVLVCSKAGPSYISRTDVEIGILFWYILIFGLSLAYLLMEHPKWVLVAPLVALFILVEAVNGRSAFMESNFGRISPSICYEVDMDILNQIQLVDQGESTELELHVPKGDNRDNWPHPNYMGKNICNTLYRAGIISRTFKIKIVPDVNMNKKYHIPVPKS